MVVARARGRAAGQIPYATGLPAGATWGRDQLGASLDPTRKLHYRPMAALFHIWVPAAARIRRDELALTLCQWAGMTVEPARTTGKCGQDLDPCLRLTSKREGQREREGEGGGRRQERISHG